MSSAGLCAALACRAWLRPDRRESTAHNPQDSDHAARQGAGPRVIGLDGVVAQQQNYRKSGFELAYANVRYGGIVAAPDAPRAGVVALADVLYLAISGFGVLPQRDDWESILHPDRRLPA